MKITSVDAIRLTGGHDKHVLCRVNTDEGIYGYGEAAVHYGAGATAAFGMVQDMAKLVIGMDPLDSEVVWDKLYKSTFWGQNGGPIVFAGIAAIDMALWDIKGKAFGVPIYRLLGGKKRDRLRAYASQLQFGWGPTKFQFAYKTKDYVDNCKYALAEGYDAVKIDYFTFKEEGGSFSVDEKTGLLPPRTLALLEERIAATREAVGPKVDIIIENHSSTDALSAVQIGRMAEKYDIFYFEEPNTPTPKMTKYISDNVGIPIASGERIYSRWQYAQYFEDCSLQVIQPDLGNCGGITEVKKICDMAYVYDVSVQLHECATPISVAASLQLEATLPNFVIHEHHVTNTTEENMKLCTRVYQPKDGYFDVPEAPGLGNELSDFALSRAQIVTVK